VTLFRLVLIKRWRFMDICCRNHHNFEYYSK